MVAQSREFLIRVFENGTLMFATKKWASSHRNAVMLVVNEKGLTTENEVEVQELIRLPKSTYRVFEHVSREIELMC